MTDPADWSRAADPVRGIGHAVEFHVEIASTNDRARAALGEPGGEGLAVVADLQTAGRGRRGRTWISPAAANLLVSVAWRPQVAPRLAGLLGVAAALAVRDACASLVPDAGLSIRWPNDVVDRDGRKVAGLLVETALEGGELAEAVVGMGINVNWAAAEMPDEIRPTATSLQELLGAPLDRVELLERVLTALDAEARALERGESPVPRLRAASWLDERRVDVDTGAATISGRVAGFADDGSLFLDTDAGRVALSVGEVARVHAAPPAGVPRVIDPLRRPDPASPQGDPDHNDVVSAQADRAAFDVLYRRYLDRVYGYAFYQLRDHHDAEDATERTFLAALHALPEFRHEGATFRAWLFRIAHNTIINARRSRFRRRTEPLPDGLDRPAPNADPAGLVLEADETRRVLSAVAELPDDRRQVVLLRFVDGLSSREIGQVMDRSEGAARVLLHRALRDLAARL